MNRRILQLALEALEARRAQIDTEIAQLYAELGRPAKKSRGERMKDYWARKHAESAAPARKRRQMTAAQKRAVSKRMKAYWAKRKQK